jgi:hypothetical protein
MFSAILNPQLEPHHMKLSARNILPATVKAVTPGAVDTEVLVERGERRVLQHPQIIVIR